MEDFHCKTLITRRSLRYTYYVSSFGESTTKCPALFFLHGFPDSARLWQGLVTKLHGLPYRIIIPDCLGYAGTDKPTDVELYGYKDQAADLVDILQEEKVEGAIIVGHDWGSVLAQRTYLHYRKFFVGMALLNTGYMIPSDQPFDLSAVNELTTKIWGYPQFAYWEFLLAPDAAKIVDENLERMWSALHGDVDGWMKKLFCIPGALRNYLLGKEQVALKSYAKDPKTKEAWLQQFREDGFNTALQMYRATASNIQLASDSTIPKDMLCIEVPTLYIVCTEDAVCRTEMMDAAKEQGIVPDLLQVVIEASHWSPMEKPDEIATHFKDFISQVCT